MESHGDVENETSRTSTFCKTRAESPTTISYHIISYLYSVFVWFWHHSNSLRLHSFQIFKEYFKKLVIPGYFFRKPFLEIVSSISSHPSPAIGHQLQISPHSLWNLAAKAAKHLTSNTKNINPQCFWIFAVETYGIWYHDASCMEMETQCATPFLSILIWLFFVGSAVWHS